MDKSIVFPFLSDGVEENVSGCFYWNTV